MKNLIYQQGDVLLYSIEAIPSGATRNQIKSRRVVLAEGEATGHAHALAPENVEVHEKDGVMYLRISAPTSLRHEEHHEQLVMPGLYEVGRVREVDPFTQEIREVRD